MAKPLNIGSASITLAPTTTEVHLAHIFEKLGFENRNAATVRALEVLSKVKN